MTKEGMVAIRNVEEESMNDLEHIQAIINDAS